MAKKELKKREKVVMVFSDDSLAVVEKHPALEVTIVRDDIGPPLISVPLNDESLKSIKDKPLHELEFDSAKKQFKELKHPRVQVS